MSKLSKLDIYSKHFLIDEPISMNNILYINALPDEIVFLWIADNISFSEKVTIPFLQFAEIFPKILIKIVQEKHINSIWVICWPWSFTKMRIVSLAMNSILFSFPYISVRSCSFFEVIPEPYIPILYANLKEYLIFDRNTWQEFFQQKDWLKNGFYQWYLSNFDINSTLSPTSTNWWDYIVFRPYIDDWEQIFKIFSKKSPQKYISPLYIKPPHITYAKQ